MKTRYVTFLIITFLLISLNTLLAYEGSGTSTDPYQIYTFSELSDVRGEITAHYILMDDIDLSEYLSSDGTGWIPIGEKSEPFQGVFDGNGKTISGLWIVGSNPGVGFFGAIGDGAVIKNLTVKTSNKGIYTTSTEAGILVGSAGVNPKNIILISNCVVGGLVHSSSNAAEVRVGGVLGIGFGTSIEYCLSEYVTVSIPETGDYAGSIVGKLNESCSVSFCTSVGGAVTGKSYVGGIAGRLYTGKTTNRPVYFEYCRVLGTQVVGNNENVGGITGACNVAIQNCYFKGVLKGRDKIWVAL